MKKTILLFVIIIAGGWFYRYPIVQIVVTPFIKSSKEAKLIDKFLDTCMSPVPNTQYIEALAQTDGWQPLPKEDLAVFKMTPSSKNLEAWGTPDNFGIVTSQETFSYGQSTTCTVALDNIRPFFTHLMFRKKLGLGSPEWEGSMLQYTYTYSWTINRIIYSSGQNTTAIPTGVKTVRLVMMIVSNDVPSTVGRPSVWLVAAIPQ